MLGFSCALRTQNEVQKSRCRDEKIRVIDGRRIAVLGRLNTIPGCSQRKIAQPVWFLGVYLEVAGLGPRWHPRYESSRGVRGS